LNTYGWSKCFFDRRVAGWVAKREPAPPQWVGLKFFNVYGPNEYHKKRMASVVYHAYPLAAKDGVVNLFESDRPGIAHGDQKRDFVYVKDVAKVVQHFLANPKANGIFNLGSGKARTFNDLARSLLTACGKPATGIRYFAMPDDLKGKYQYFTEADLTRLRAAGYGAAMTTIEAGVGEYVRGHLAEDFAIL
jgi:ADP-L-glycero-D-manno-heptose 6-epimerase